MLHVTLNIPFNALSQLPGPTESRPNMTDFTGLTRLFTAPDFGLKTVSPRTGSDIVESFPCGPDTWTGQGLVGKQGKQGQRNMAEL